MGYANELAARSGALLVVICEDISEWHHNIGVMVQQAICADGGIVSQPVRYFRENENTYRYIEERLNGTRGSYLGADRETRIRLLFNSATYALLTARTPLPRADRAYEIYLDVFPEISGDELGTLWKDVGLGLNMSKANYVTDNWNNKIDIFKQSDKYLIEGNIIQAQDHLMNVKGIGPAKSAFLIAMLGFTDTACADSHICRYFDIDPKSYEKHDAEEYQELVETAFSNVQPLVEETSLFLAQWITWDVARGSGGSHAPKEQQGNITLHDSFFRSINTTITRKT